MPPEAESPIAPPGAEWDCAAGGFCIWEHSICHSEQGRGIFKRFLHDGRNDRILTLAGASDTFNPRSFTPNQENSMSDLPAGVLRHPPIHLLDDELTLGNLPKLIVHEATRFFGGEVNVHGVKVRCENGGPHDTPQFLIMWSVVPSHLNSERHRFRISGGAEFHKLEEVEVPRPARDGCY